MSNTHGQFPRTSFSQNKQHQTTRWWGLGHKGIGGGLGVAAYWGIRRGGNICIFICYLIIIVDLFPLRPLNFVALNPPPIYAGSKASYS